MQQTYKELQKVRCIAFIEELPETSDRPDIVDWNEANRYVSIGNSPVHGAYDRATAPHMVEILRRLSPADPCTRIALLKGVQSCGTFHSELAMAYWIRHQIGSMGFFTADLGLAKIRSSANIDPMIDDTGLIDCVKPHSKRNARKISDSTYYKEFVGGIKLTINSYGSIGGMKSNTIAFMILDEIDEAADELKGQGDILSLLAGRTIAVRHFKIFALSTPTTMETSKIYRLFLEGDQRYYNVPCPKCGEKQILVMSKGRPYGLTYELKGSSKDIVEQDSVRYICRHCKDYFKESKKQWCLENGVWIPTAEGQSPLKHSYHVSGLLSPEQMLSWGRIAGKHAETNEGKNILKYKDFMINIDGWPWSRVEKQTDEKTFKAHNLKNYCLGTIPRGALMLLAGTDIQKDRIETMVVGFGHGFRRWFVDYRIFYGDIANPNDLAWASLDDFIRNQTYLILGQEKHIHSCAVDCGYDPKEQRDKDWTEKSHTVYNFVGLRYPLFVPIRGSGVLKGWDVIKESRTANPICPNVYMLNSPVLKELMTREILVRGDDMLINWPAMMADGRPLDDEYIKQFLCERYVEIKPGVMGWKKSRSRNEALDTWLYATALGYYHGIANWNETMWDTYQSEITNA